MLRLCSLNAESLRNKSAHFVCYASVQLERMFLQLLRHGFLSLMTEANSRDLNVLTIPAMVVGAVEQRYW